MRDCALVWIVGVKITKRAPQERKQLRLMMIALGANLNQLDKVSGGLSAEIILADAGERILEDDFGQRVQGRSAAGDDRALRFEKEIELARERRLRATRAFGDRSN